jgi:glycosyltransferase involved in cell wall biosynthesis
MTGDPAQEVRPAAAAARPPRVVMIVANPCTHDARVIREAETLAAAGYEVRVLCKLTRNVAVPLLETRNGVVYERFQAPKPRPVAVAPPAPVATPAPPPPARPQPLPPPAATAARPPGTARGAAAVESAAVEPDELALAPAGDDADEHRSLLSPLRRAARHLWRGLKRATRRGWRALRRAARRGWRSLKRAARRGWRKLKRWARLRRRDLRLTWRELKRWARLRRRDLRLAWRELRRKARWSPDKIVARWLAPTRRWRELAAAVVPRLVELAPEVIHAHDLETLEAGFQAARRTGARLVYDAHEIEVGRMPPRPWLHRLQIEWQEGRRIRAVDAVVTVGHGLARYFTERYGAPPATVVFNTPKLDPGERAPGELRRACGLGPGTPLAVYVGNIGAGRGILTSVAALVHAPEVHLAIIGPHRPAYQALVEAAARAHGVSERLHILPPVPPQHVVSHVASATFGICLIEDTCLNHRLSMPNKLFEMTFAGLPLVGSDLPEIGRYLRETGVGLAVDPTDPVAIAAAFRELAAHAPRYRPDAATLARVAATYGWPAQAEKLLDLYAGLVGRPRPLRAAA